MKTKKLNIGYYTFTYKGYNVIISDWYDPLKRTKKMWYFTINDGEANDLLLTKKDAIDAAIEVIDNPQIYSI